MHPALRVRSPLSQINLVSGQHKNHVTRYPIPNPPLIRSFSTNSQYLRVVIINFLTKRYFVDLNPFERVSPGIILIRVIHF